MFMKSILLLAALAAPALASSLETVTCTPVNATRSIITSITDANNFCTFLTGYGVTPVAPNEGCGGVYCQGAIESNGLPMPKGYILSSNYATTANYTQITGCIDSSVWAQSPTDEGGQMDSHGWKYTCTGFAKFVSLIEPATNTFCLRCCKYDDNVDCNTSISTKGCWNVVPGLYQMADGSVCKPPVGAPVANSTVAPTGISGALPSATAPAGPVPTGGATGTAGAGAAGASGTSLPSASKPSSAARASSSYEFIGAVAALAMAVVATL